MHTGEMNSRPARDGTISTVHDNTEARATRSDMPTKELWERNRSNIAHLYREAGHTLQQVRIIMQERFNFIATIPMYRNRIHEWGLDKNLKRCEVIYAVQLIKRRKEQGKETRLRIRGKEVPESEIQRYFRRAPFVIDWQQDDNVWQSIQVPRDFNYPTPSPPDTSRAVAEDNDHKHNNQDEGLPLAEQPDQRVTQTDRIRELESTDSTGSAQVLERLGIATLSHQLEWVSCSREDNLPPVLLYEARRANCQYAVSCVEMATNLNHRETDLETLIWKTVVYERLQQFEARWQAVDLIFDGVQELIVYPTLGSWMELLGCLDAIYTSWEAELKGEFIRYIYKLSETINGKHHPFTSLLTQILPILSPDFFRQAFLDLGRMLQHCFGCHNEDSFKMLRLSSIRCDTPALRHDAMRRLLHIYDLAKDTPTTAQDVIFALYASIVDLLAADQNLAQAFTWIQEWQDRLLLDPHSLVSITNQVNFLTALAGLEHEAGWVKACHETLTYARNAVSASSLSGSFMMLDIESDFVKYSLALPQCLKPVLDFAQWVSRCPQPEDELPLFPESMTREGAGLTDGSETEFQRNPRQQAEMTDFNDFLFSSETTPLTQVISADTFWQSSPVCNGVDLSASQMHESDTWNDLGLDGFFDLSSILGRKSSDDVSDVHEPAEGKNAVIGTSRVRGEARNNHDHDSTYAGNATPKLAET